MQSVFAESPKKMKLFVLPYAGGSTSAFSKWKAHIAGHIDFIPVELAGRGKRMSEVNYKDLSAAVEDVYNIILPQIQNHEYALFGHSMGSLLIHELTKKMRDTNNRMPRHLFFSGRGAIQVKRPDDKIYHLMPDDLFRKEIDNLGGTPPEFFEYPELMELFLPLIKSDFAIAETNIELDNFEPINVDITVFNGNEDDITSEQHEGWKFYTSRTCHMHIYEGDHFFLNHKMEEMMQIINATLSAIPSI